jgi:hypothetical protein
MVYERHARKERILRQDQKALTAGSSNHAASAFDVI